MTDLKISDLASAGAVTGAEAIPVVQSGGTVKLLVSAIRAWLFPAGGTTGQVLAKASATDYDFEWQTASGGGGGGASDLISRTVLGTAEASVTLAVPAGFEDLVLTVSGRATTGTDVEIYMQFNGDTGATYDWTRWNRFGTTVGSATASIDIGALPGGSVPANISSAIIVTVPQYLNTTFQKAVDCVNAHKASAANGLTQHVAGAWESLSAVTSITLFIPSNSFVAGTVFSLSGRGAAVGGGSVSGDPRITQRSGSFVRPTGASDTGVPTGYVTPGLFNMENGCSSFGFPVAGNESPTVAANECYARPLKILRNTQITTIKIFVNAAVAAQTVSYRIYANGVDGRPSTPVSEKMTLSLAATGLVTLVLASPVTLTPGLYWVLVTNTTTTATCRSVSGCGALPIYNGGFLWTGLYQAAAAARLDSADLSASTWTVDSGATNISSTRDTGFFDFTIM